MAVVGGGQKLRFVECFKCCLRDFKSLLGCFWMSLVVFSGF